MDHRCQSMLSLCNAGEETQCDLPAWHHGAHMSSSNRDVKVSAEEGDYVEHEVFHIWCLPEQARICGSCHQEWMPPPIAKPECPECQRRGL
jgi:hypothetical protein